MRIIKLGVMLSMWWITPILVAQNTDVSLILADRLEELYADEEEPDWEDELQELSQYLTDPVNLNTATRKQLEIFPFLTDIQIENLLAHIYIHGPMQTLYELQLVEEMDKRTIELLLPFVCAYPVENRTYPSFKNILKYGKHEVLTRLDLPFYTRKGYEKNYTGPPWYHSLRYSFHYGDHIQAGVTGEKDAGEPFFALHDRKGYDHYSYYFLLQHRGWLRSLALGCYRLSFGQGLVLGNGFQLGKSYSLSTSEFRRGGIRKHGSTDEYNYFRGAAATVGITPAFALSAFYSHRSMDGVVEDGEITSIYKTGLHRTAKEAAKTHAFNFQLMGGNLTYDRSRIKLGITGIYYFFDRPYEPTLREYAKYNLHGNHFHNLSVDYQYRSGRFAWFGEAAMGKKGYALLNHVRYRLFTDCQLLLIHRYYSHDYWSFFGRAFGEGSTPQNENGWYVAMEANPWRNWHFFASVDMFSFPWWKYRISKPSQGFDLMFQAAYHPKERLSMYINYRYKRKERDVTGTSGKSISPIPHHRLRYRLTYATDFLTLRTTLDYNHFRQQDVDKYRFSRRQGWQCTQMCAYTFPSFPLSVSLQGTYFHTDDYDSRVYASERGLLYTFYTPSFSGRGFRYSAHLRYDMNKFLMLLVKFGHTLYPDRETISSGNDLILGNKKADLQMQLRLKF